MNLRPYQLRVCESVQRGWGEFRKQLIVVPTGGGKTVIFSHLAKQTLPGRTLILAHREELIDQAIAKLKSATGIIAEKEKAEHVANRAAGVVVTSVQTMIRRLDRWPKDHFRLIVADEAHHSISDSWHTVLKHFDAKARVLGVTATPDRGDKRNLGSYYDNIAAEVGLFDLIGDGYLSRITLKTIPLQIDLSGVGSVAGDFAERELGETLEPYLDQIAAAIRDHASFRRVLVFLPLILTSQKFVAACESVGLSACHIDGESTDRREILDRFAAGGFDVLSNAMLLTEGFDDPGIDCVVNLRPTRSRSLYSQIIGRGTRIAEFKDDLLLLDFLWSHKQHSIVRPAHLVAKTEEEAEVITGLAMEKAAAMPADVASQIPLDLEGLATEAQSKREESLRKKLEANRKKKGQTMSAEEFALQHHKSDLADYEPAMAWERKAVTPKQEKYLKQARIDLGTVTCAGHASQLLDLHFKNKSLEMASPRVKEFMRRMGDPNWENATAQQGRRFMAGLKT